MLKLITLLISSATSNACPPTRRSDRLRAPGIPYRRIEIERSRRRYWTGWAWTSPKPRGPFGQTKRQPWFSLGLGSWFVRKSRGDVHLLSAQFEAAQERREIERIEEQLALDGLRLRRVALLITTGRLVVWTAIGVCAVSRPAGGLPLSRIESASRTFVSGAQWRTIQIRTLDDAVFQFQVVASSVEPVLAALAG